MTETGHFTIRPITPTAEGHPVVPLVLEPPGPYTAGRSSEADWRIQDQAISRKHASFEHFGDAWFIADLGSRHGTTLNGNAVKTGDRLTLRSGDMLRFGHWACRCDSHRSPTAGFTTSVDKATDRSRVGAVRGENLAGVAQRRLDTLLKTCGEFNDATDRESIAKIVAHHAAEGTNSHRAVVARPRGEDEFELLASTVDDDDDCRLSRSLIATAQTGEVAQLSQDAGNHGQSIIDLNISTALCAPILVGGVPDAFLYLDTRGTESRLAPDAAAFCQALVQMAGFAFERVLRAEFEDRRLQIEQDLSAARRAQELLMPPRSGVAPGLTYSFESLAGRFVAGDLFDIVPLDQHRTVFYLGDVSGKGIGAAVLMAAAQSQLRSLLLRDTPLTDAATTVSRYLNRHSEANKFITLVAAVIDIDKRSVEVVDAGHGFCCLAEPGKPARRIETPGGLPLGVVDDTVYEHAVFELLPGARMIAFSDGVVEQTNPAGEQFGFDAALDILTGTDSPAKDAAALIEAVQQHAGGPLADDLTVASIAYTP